MTRRVLTLMHCTLLLLPLVTLRGRWNGPCCGSQCPPMLSSARVSCTWPSTAALSAVKCSAQGFIFMLCHSACTKGSLICSEGPGSSAICLFFFLCLFFSSMSAPLKAYAVFMELCFLVNNDSFHSSRAFSPVAEIDGAEGKEKGFAAVLKLSCLSWSPLHVFHRRCC